MRINFFGSAGCGKSTVSSGVFYELKTRGFNVELIAEYIKKWAYENKIPKSFEQVYIFGKQLNSEDRLLNSGVQHLVTDSPIAMQIFYARKTHLKCWEALADISNAFEEKYPSINIFLDREGIPYQKLGRFENEDQAKQNDQEMLEFMREFVPNHTIVRSSDLYKIMGCINSSLIDSSQSS